MSFNCKKWGKISEQKMNNLKTVTVSRFSFINAQEKPFKVSKNATFLLCQWLRFSWMHVWITFKNMETRGCLIENLRVSIWKTRETRFTENMAISAWEEIRELDTIQFTIATGKLRNILFVSEIRDCIQQVSSQQELLIYWFPRKRHLKFIFFKPISA